MRQLNSRQIEAFRALMLTSSTVRAAEMMHVTQPAVSRLVRELQAAVGLTLFERYGNRLRPTNDALALYGEVERSFLGLERIAQAAAELRGRRMGVLRVATMPALSNGFLPRYVARFLADHPRLELTLSGLPTPAVVDWVVAEQCDIGFAAAPVAHAAVRVEMLPPIPYVAIVPERHRLAANAVVRPRDFEKEEFVALASASPSRFRIDDVFAKDNVSLRIRVETPLAEIACALVASGAGVSVVDACTAEQYSTSGIVVRPFTPGIEFQLAALYPARRDLTGVARDFLNGFARTVADWTRTRAHAAPHARKRAATRRARSRSSA